MENTNILKAVEELHKIRAEGPYKQKIIYEIINNKVYYTADAFAKYCIADLNSNYITSVTTCYNTDISSVEELKNLTEKIKYDYKNKEYRATVFKIFNNNLILLKLKENNRIIATGCGNCDYSRGPRGFAGRGPKISAVPNIGDEVIVKNIYETDKGLRAYHWNYSDIYQRIVNKGYYNN